MNVLAKFLILNMRKSNVLAVIILGIHFKNLIIYSETCSIPLDAAYCLTCDGGNHWAKVIDGGKTYCQCAKGFYENN